MKSIVLLLSIFNLNCLFAQDLIPYKKGSAWGYCNKDKKIIIEPKYKEAQLFQNGLARVVFEGKYGIIDTKGNVVVPFEYKYGEIGSFAMNRIFFKKNGYYGFYNGKGEVVIEPEYEFAFTFFNKRAATPAKKDGKYGIIDTSNKVLLPFNQPPISAISKTGYMTTYTDKGNGLIDMRGKEIVPPIYKEQTMHKKTQAKKLRQHFMTLRRKDGARNQAVLFNNGSKLLYYTIKNYMAYDHFFKQDYLQVGIPGSKGGFGLVDINGDLIVQWDKFPFVGNYNDNAVAVGQRKGSGFVWGLIDNKGKVILKPKYEKIYMFDQNGIARFKIKDKYGFVNDKGDVIQKEKEYEGVSGFGACNNGLMYYKNTNGTGIMDYSGKVILEADKKYRYNFHHGFIEKKDNATKKYWLLDRSGKVITEAYDDIQDITMGFKLKNNGKYGFMTKEGKKILEVEYDKVSISNATEKITVTKSGLKALYDLSGNELLPLKYKDFKQIRNTENFWVKDGYKWKVVDKSGKQLNENTYSSIKYVGGGYYAVYKSKWGLMDPNGNLVVDHVCREPIKEVNTRDLKWVVKAGSIIYGYIGKDYTLYWE